MTEFLRENGAILILTLVLAGVWFYRTFIAPLMRENDFKRQVQNIAEPVLILQGFEGHDEFWQGVERAREQFRQSGNKFAEKQNPVVGIPYNGVFKIEWFGQVYDLSTVGMKRMEYLLAALEVYKILYAAWAKEVYGAHGEKVFQEMMQKQKPFTENDRTAVWEK